MLRLSGSGLSMVVGAGGAAVTLTISSFDARLLPTKVLVLHAVGSIGTTGLPGLGFGGALSVDYNPTTTPLTVGGVLIAANTARVAGTGVTVTLPGGVTLTGSLAVTRSGSTVLIDAEDVSAVVGSATGPRLTLTGGTLHLVRTTTGTTLDASGQVALVGGTTGFAVAGVLAVHSDATTTTVTGTGLTLTLPGVTASGDLTATVSAGVVTLTVAAGTLHVGDLVDAAGVTGSVTLGGTPTVALSAASTTVDLGGAVLTGPVSVVAGSGSGYQLRLGTSGQLASLTVAGRPSPASSTWCARAAPPPSPATRSTCSSAASRTSRPAT